MADSARARCSRSSWGIGVSREWQTFLLWRNGSRRCRSATTEPLFHRDPAFYIFSLPWLRSCRAGCSPRSSASRCSSGIAHYLWGGIRPQAPRGGQGDARRSAPHLSVLLGLIMLAKAWGYYLGRFDLLTSPRGVVEGASYTDVHAQLPALNFLVIVAVICAVLFLVNIRVRLWSLPVIAVGLLALVSVLLGAAYPAFVQQFRVKPQEQQRETPYIDGQHRRHHGRRSPRQDRHLQRPADADVRSRGARRRTRPTVDNIRLWRPSRPLGELPVAAADPAVLRVQGRRRGPLRRSTASRAC